MIKGTGSERANARAPQMQAEMPLKGPLGSASNPIPPGESRPGWDDDGQGVHVVHSETDGFVQGR